MNQIKLIDLYKLFFCKKLIEPIIITNQQNISSHHIFNLTLTPTSKKIYNATSPNSKPYILQDLLKNTQTIEDLESKIDLLDPDYQEKFQNNGLGFFMEDYICAYGKCPVCGQATLRKYSQSNVPVIDLVCINTDYHLKKNKCFIFQIKISLTNNYFSLKNKILIVGSKNYGKISHIHTGLEPIINKIVVPGYICVKLKKVDEINQEYVIDYKSSFSLIPNYQNKSSENYYDYIDVSGFYGKNIISWNDSMVDVINLNDVLDNNKIKYEVFQENESSNPYCDLMFLLK
ncbi:hypothetical protein ma591 [Moumouvirus australiensis]|uniref:Uncharacterized protein n=1 Tax=Moumouvirus australiensis TaxID=2109587 RepID=A0A2P1EM52_9VIRU|nr:hypothetical protein QKC55_gp314 [Moumouvirus australiensis]AVL94977.1 hypothetical protein ma591 [Moumouvirus australiensis]